MMELQRMSKLLFFLSCCLISGRSVLGYKNYTVGDSLGWFDNLEKPLVNYQSWVHGKIFSLGDFLIFNSDNNHSIIQTYNVTTYKQCDYDNALDNDTIQWSALNPSAVATDPVSVAVPLLKEGMTYFFSSDYDGEQCENGQHFQVNVTHGQGLPDSLKPESEQAPAPNSPDIQGDDSAPETTVPSNFDNPKDTKDDDDDEDVKKTSGSVCLSMFMEFSCRNVLGTLLLLGFISSF